MQPMATRRTPPAPPQPADPGWRPRIDVNIDKVDHALWMALRIECAERRALSKPSRQADVIEGALKGVLGATAMQTYRSLIAAHGEPAAPGSAANKPI